MAEKIFADGFAFDKPSDNAPEWVKGKISVRVNDAIKFLEAHRNERGFVNLDVKEGKTGKLYIELNTYKREGSAQQESSGAGIAYPVEDINPDDIPF